MISAGIPSINPSPRVKRPVPPKEILWPTAIGFGNAGGSDSSQFPELRAIRAREAAVLAHPLTAFVDAVRAAQDRVLVMDRALFKPDGGRPPDDRIAQILDWLQPGALAATDIRFLTGAVATRSEETEIRRTFTRYAAQLNQLRRPPLGPAIIDVRFSLRREFPYLHDRFAIVDDDLWHFGATVGGLHNLVNAASHGWDIEEHLAVAFFEMAWSTDTTAGDLAGRRRRP